jgi:molecular chaperone DnaK
MQTNLQTMIYQGNRPIAKQNRLLGEYTLSGIAAAPAGVPKIEVTFDISADGLIRVSSMDKATKQKQSVTINLSGGLSEADIERMKAEAESNASADAAFKDRLVKSNEVSKKIQTIKSTVDSYKTIAADVKAKLTEEIEKANLVVQNEKSTSKQIEDAYASLKAISDPILTSAYHSQASSGTTEENKS